MKQTKKEHKKDIALASQMGKEAFQRGVLPAPALDGKFQALMKKYSSPDFSGTKQLIALMDAWSTAWHHENLTSTVN